MNGDELHPNEKLHSAVAALRATPALAPGLAERTVRRGRKLAARRRIAISTASLSVAAVAVLAILRPAQDAGYHTFALVAPASAGVSLVGDFTDWETDRVRLEPKGDDRWEVKIKLPPGRYRFAYVTDEGNWLADANAAPALDEFGTPTSVVTVSSE